MTTEIKSIEEAVEKFVMRVREWKVTFVQKSFDFASGKLRAAAKRPHDMKRELNLFMDKDGKIWTLAPSHMPGFQYERLTRSSIGFDPYTRTGEFIALDRNNHNTHWAKRSSESDEDWVWVRVDPYKPGETTEMSWCTANLKDDVIGLAFADSVLALEPKAIADWARSRGDLACLNAKGYREKSEGDSDWSAFVEHFDLTFGRFRHYGLPDCGSISCQLAVLCDVAANAKIPLYCY